MYNRIIGVIILFVYLPLNLEAQPGKYNFTRLDITQGLSHNQVNCILKDSKGFMWFGTMSGLNRYDGYGFKKFKSNIQDTTSISDNYIIRISEDHLGNLWVTNRSGISIYDPKTETFRRSISSVLKQYSIKGGITDFYNDQKGALWFTASGTGLYRYDIGRHKTTFISRHSSDIQSIHSNNISNVMADSRGNLWIIYSDAVLEKLDRRTNKIVGRTTLISRNFNRETSDFNIFIDKSDDVWVYSPNTPNGVACFSEPKNELTLFNKDCEKGRLSNNMVRGIVQDDRGMIWIGTDHGGINLLDKQTRTVRYLVNTPDDETSLSQNSIITLYKDNTGIIWVGTFKKGLNYYHENIVKFQLFKHNALSQNCLPYDDVNCFAEDGKGNLWIGTNGGGLIYFNRTLGTFSRYVHDPRNSGSLSNDIIVYLFIDSNQKLWIGTYYGGLNCMEGGTFIHYHHDPSNTESVNDDRIWKIFEDSRKNLWIGTLGGGLDLFDRKANKFIHYRPGDNNSIRSKCVISLAGDKAGNLWVGTAEGIDVLDRRTGRFSHLQHDPNNRSSLSNNNVIIIKEDSRGLIWVGTREGLNLYDPKTKTFQIFREENGLPDNTILTILEDKRGQMWVSTPNGLANIVVSRSLDGKYAFGFKRYDESDGLQGKEFNENAGLATRHGELVFGGANGFNIFNPADIRVNKNIPEVVLTDFLIFNKSVRVGDKINGRAILENSISEAKEIELKYSENVFCIEFSALSYFHPEKNKYKFKLEGFNKDWVTTDGKNRKAVYTNLDPGEYTFWVKASNNDGFWNEKGARIRIIILPPFWKTKTALLIYILLVTGALYLSRRLLLQRERLTYKVEQERQEARRMHELDMMKIKFFTNVSHEFRTPLTLIITPLEKIIKNTVDNEQKNQFQLIYRNARRLLNLVNQLLDFRRLEVREMKLNPSRGDIVKFIKDLSFSFSDISEKKDIKLSFSSEIAGLETFFDQDKLEKIVFNLLSNAFKFTPEHGSVMVSLNLTEKPGNAVGGGETDDRWLEIRVSDTGIGIPADKLEKIFESFFQNDLPGNMINQGSGIGLALTREFVKLHNGEVRVESEPDKGSCFTVSIPLKGSMEVINYQAVETEIQSFEMEPKPMPENLNEKGNSKIPVLLLVEDNEDFRFYLKDNLKANYRIVEAGNGKDGWKQALGIIPDLIVSDIMMPEMNGIELCHKLKSDQRTSHIPVILLTAMATEEQKVDGFETGADEYITKPFSFEILESRIKNLIAQRESLRKTFHKQIEINPSEISVTSLDEKLIQKALDVVEKNISNPDFSVEELSRDLAMSRVHLYKKLLSLTGKTPIEFIRTIRLKRAARLLEKSQLSVSEIAYQVGFNNPKYFTRYFKAEFNTLPSQYTSKGDKEEPEELTKCTPG